MIRFFIQQYRTLLLLVPTVILISIVAPSYLTGLATGAVVMLTLTEFLDWYWRRRLH